MSILANEEILNQNDKVKKLYILEETCIKSLFASFNLKEKIYEKLEYQLEVIILFNFDESIKKIGLEQDIKTNYDRWRIK